MPIIVQSPTPTEEDATPTTPPRPISRRKSRLEQWIGDQHAHTGGDQGDGIAAQGSSPNSYPYLTYCDTRQARSSSCDIDSRSIPDSFVLVDGDDGCDGIGDSCREELNGFEVRANHHVTYTVLIYAHSPHRHLLSLVCALLRARVATPPCFAHPPLSVLSVSLCPPHAAPPLPPTIPPLASITIPPTDSPSQWGDMVAHSATDISLPLSYKAVHQKPRPPPLPPDPVVHGHSNVPACWGRSRPQAQMSLSTKGPRSTCPHRGLASHLLSLSPPVPQGHRQTHLHPT